MQQRRMQSSVKNSQNTQPKTHTMIDRIEETDNDMTTTFNENDGTQKTMKTIDQCLLMTNVEDASLIYKIAGTVVSS